MTVAFILFFVFVGVFVYFESRVATAQGKRRYWERITCFICGVILLGLFGIVSGAILSFIASSNFGWLSGVGVFLFLLGILIALIAIVASAFAEDDQASDDHKGRPSARSYNR